MAELKVTKQMIEEVFNNVLNEIQLNTGQTLNECIEKQIPKKVQLSGDGYADGEIVYDIAECPECGHVIELDRDEWGLPYCAKCGQAISWENEE